MLIGQQIFETLAGDADSPEASQSGYWQHHVAQFSISADGDVTGATVLGNISRRQSPIFAFAHWVLQTPFRFMGRKFKEYKECERIGRLIARRQGRQFTHDMVRQVLSLALILEHISVEDSSQCNLVIGDGFGVLTSLFLHAAPHRRTITVNLTKPLLVDLTHIQMAVPDVNMVLVSSPEEMTKALAMPEVNLIAVRADAAEVISEAPIGVAANVCSMQEMDPQVIAGYFKVLRQNPAETTAFYCANKWVKKFQDGSKIRFEEYPWQKDDVVLWDSPCPWSQLFYGKTPPFYSYRHDPEYVIWHRLAQLVSASKDVDLE